MDRKEAAKLLPIIRAFIAGMVIECRTRTWEVNKGWQYSTDWEKTEELKFQDTYEYRIKPEPTYRPFANTEECWTEMEKHQPFGWVKTKDKGIRLCIIGLNQGSAFTQVGHKYDEALDEFIFADGAPFGIKEEE